MPTIVHITSCRYSGSTWLNLMLGAHARLFSVGELDAVLKSGRAECIVHGAGCPTWHGFSVNGPSVLNDIARIARREVLVLNNAPMSLDLAVRGGLPVKHVVLLRDGRAVTASEIRKNPDLSMRRAARRWARRIAEIRQIVPQSERLELRYESLRDDTLTELRRVCEFLGVEADPGMVEYWREPRCFLGGNLGTHMAAAHKQDRDLPPETYTSYAQRDDRQWDLDFYRRSASDRFKDERWRSELTALQRATFALLAGRVNRHLGY